MWGKRQHFSFFSFVLAEKLEGFSWRNCSLISRHMVFKGNSIIDFKTNKTGWLLREHLGCLFTGHHAKKGNMGE